MNANESEYQIQIFIRVFFAVLLVRFYPIEIDFDDSKWWCSPSRVLIDANQALIGGWISVCGFQDTFK